MLAVSERYKTETTLDILILVSVKRPTLPRLSFRDSGVVPHPLPVLSRVQGARRGLELGECRRRAGSTSGPTCDRRPGHSTRTLGHQDTPCLVPYDTSPPRGSGRWGLQGSSLDPTRSGCRCGSRGVRGTVDREGVSFLRQGPLSTRCPVSSLYPTSPFPPGDETLPEGWDGSVEGPRGVREGELWGSVLMGTHRRSLFHEEERSLGYDVIGGPRILKNKG